MRWSYLPIGRVFRYDTMLVIKLNENGEKDGLTIWDTNCRVVSVTQNRFRNSVNDPAFDPYVMWKIKRRGCLQWNDLRIGGLYADSYGVWFKAGPTTAISILGDPTPVQGNLTDSLTYCILEVA